LLLLLIGGCGGDDGTDGAPGPPGADGAPAGQHLASLTCTEEGDIAVFNGLLWVCQSDLLRFVDNGDGTITDNLTGLMWERKLAADGSDGGNCAAVDQVDRDIHCVNNLYSWATGGSAPNGTMWTVFLTTINLDATDDPKATCHANYCDWRIPTVVELQSILHTPFPNCTVDPCIADGFSGPTQAFDYWSSTTFASDPGDAWVVGFDDGSVSNSLKSNGIRVRAVRLGDQGTPNHAP
jgi:hypothetical protein